jgi:aminoglycoside phosphotransferase (APT) family kinase protein
MTLPDQVLALVAAALPGQPIADLKATEGGFSHRTALATIAGRRCLIKAAEAPAKRADVRHEARVLALLRGQGLPAPEPIALAEGEGWTVGISAALPGRAGISLYAQPELLPQAYRELGRLLARVHAAPLPPPTPALLLAERARADQAALPELGLPPALSAELDAALAHPAWRPAAPHLVHGDAGLHNLIWDDGAAALVDWEWSGWGAPALDLAWVGWTMRWRAVDPGLWDVFLGAYRAAGGAPEAPDPATNRALALGQIAGILVRVRDQLPARAEWLRRAHWTLDAFS